MNLAIRCFNGRFDVAALVDDLNLRAEVDLTAGCKNLVQRHAPRAERVFHEKDVYNYIVGESANELHEFTYHLLDRSMRPT